MHLTRDHNGERYLILPSPICPNDPDLRRLYVERRDVEDRLYWEPMTKPLPRILQLREVLREVFR